MCEKAVNVDQGLTPNKSKASLLEYSTYLCPCAHRKLVMSAILHGGTNYTIHNSLFPSEYGTKKVFPETYLSYT